MNVGWSPVMSVGVPALDSDHKCLIRIVSLLHGVQDGEEARTMIDTALDALRLYTWFHFKREERVLREIDYPEVAFHCSEHNAFARYLDDLQAHFSGRAEMAMAAGLYHELLAWIRHHILIQDMTFKPYVTDPVRAERIARAGTAACLINLGVPPQRSFPVTPIEVPVAAAAQ